MPDYASAPEFNRRMAEWLSRNPEPKCPPQGCDQAEYNEYLRKHQVWTSDKRIAQVAAERVLANRQAARIAAVAEPAAEYDFEEIDTGAGAVFPIEVFPEAIRVWAEATAEFTQTPITLAATAALMACMTAGIHLSVLVVTSSTAGGRHASRN
jgi:hypothetical protein